MPTIVDKTMKRQKLTQEALCQATCAATELDDGMRFLEGGTRLEFRYRRVLVKALKVLEGAEPIVESPRLAVAEFP